MLAGSPTGFLRQPLGFATAGDFGCHFLPFFRRFQRQPADAAIAEEQAEWKASLATSCETVTPEDEKLACETRLMQARVTSLQERFPK